MYKIIKRKFIICMHTTHSLIYVSKQLLTQRRIETRILQLLIFLTNY